MVLTTFLLILLSSASALLASSTNRTKSLAIRARRQNCGTAGYCGNVCCLQLNIKAVNQDNCCTESAVRPNCVCETVTAEVAPIQQLTYTQQPLITQQTIAQPIQVVQQQPVQVVQDSCLCSSPVQSNQCSSPCTVNSQDVCCIILLIAVNPCCVSPTQRQIIAETYTTPLPIITTVYTTTTPAPTTAVAQSTNCLCSAVEGLTNPCCIQIEIQPVCECILPATDPCCYPTQQSTNVCGVCGLSPELPSDYSLQVPQSSVDCAPTCQPACLPSCIESFNELQSQYGGPTVPCDAQVCVCPSGYVKCAEQTCCLRYRYMYRKAKRQSE